MPDLPPLLGLSDIAQRWKRSREFVRLHMRDADAFPAPAGSINNGRNRFWLERDLAAYEGANPHVVAGAEGRRRPSGTRSAPPSRSERRPTAFVLAFTFDQKPPFAFRERLKKEGWTYSPERREWIGRVKAEDAGIYRREFAEEGARSVRDEPQFD